MIIILIEVVNIVPLMYNGIIYEGFYATKDGNIIGRTGKVLKKSISKQNRHRITIRPYGKDDISVCLRVYGAVYESFKGTYDKNLYDIHHIDKNSLNDSLDNLTLLTKEEHYEVHRQDNADRVKELFSADNSTSAKLTWENVKFIREHYIPRDKTFGTRGLGRIFEVNHKTIQDIINNKTWKEEENI